MPEWGIDNVSVVLNQGDSCSKMRIAEIAFDPSISGETVAYRARLNGSLVFFYGVAAEASLNGRIDSAWLSQLDNCYEQNFQGMDISLEKKSIVAPIDSNFYLGIVFQDFDVAYAYEYEGGTQIPDVFYGWIECHINEDGSLSVVKSAIDLDGGPMIVGGGAYSIPEPSGGLLFILGAAALGLRRRRGSPPYHGGVRFQAAAAAAPGLAQSTPKTRISSVSRWR